MIAEKKPLVAGSKEWLGNQIAEYKAQQHAYETYAHVLRHLLQGACMVDAPFSIVQAREKALASFAEKCLRKMQKYPDPVHQFTDLAGGRIITCTQAEADRMGQIIRKNFVIDEKNSEDVRERLKSDQFGYRSVHYIIQMPWMALLGNGVFQKIAKRLANEKNEKVADKINTIGDREADKVFGRIFREAVTGNRVDLFEDLTHHKCCENAELHKRAIEEALKEKDKYKAPLDIICAIGNRKAEIQVCTLLQHAWAAISHDRLYKSSFHAPKKLERQLHRVSALLEEADDEFERGISELDEYKLDYGAYMTPEAIREEIKRLAMVAEHERRDVGLALKIAGLAIAVEDWKRVIKVLKPHSSADNAGVLCDLGLAKSKTGQGGRTELERATELAPQAPVAYCRLGDTYCCCQPDTKWRGDKRPERQKCKDALENYGHAFAVALSDPHTLGKYLQCKICSDRNVEFLPLLRPSLEAAMQKSERLAQVRVHVPWVFYDMGEFALLLGKPYDSLWFFAKAVYLSDSEQPIEMTLASLERIQEGLESSKDRPEWAPHLEWMRRFLRMAKVAKLRQLERGAQKHLDAREKDLAAKQKELSDRLEEIGDGKAGQLKGEDEEVLKKARKAVGQARIAVRKAGVALKAAEEKADKALTEFQRYEYMSKPPRGGRRTFEKERPLVIVAGGCDPRFEPETNAYRALLLAGFRDFQGTIISAGTTKGIGGLVGDVQENRGDAVRTIGYFPKPKPSNLPPWVKEDRRYTEIRHAPGDELLALEPLQNWIDIIASGIKPHDVKVLGINGGTVAGAEYRIALALGACVAVLDEGGRAAARLLPDEDWGQSERLMVLPAEEEIIREYLRSGIRGSFGLTKNMREAIAREIHQEYLNNRMKGVTKSEPSLEEWDKLPENLKESNRQQVDHVFEKLRLAKCAWDRAERPKSFQFREDEIEKLAEVEHARFLVERFLDGWKWGEKKNVDKKINPTLVGWSKLLDDAKNLDRTAVRKIPEHLEGTGIEIKREDD